MVPLVVILGAFAAPAERVTWRPTELGTPDFSPCVVPPRKVEAAPTDAAPATRPRATERFSSWPSLDLAHPDTSPEALHARTPPDPARPPAPLQGAPEDLAKVAAVLHGTPSHALRIAVWGDSHTAGDALVGQLRRTLQARMGDGGSGFVLPFAPFMLAPVGRMRACAKGDWKVRITGQTVVPGIGLAGGSAVGSSAAETVWIDVDDERRTGASTRLTLLFQRAEGAGGVRLRVDQSAPLVVPTAGAAATLLVEATVPVGPHRLHVELVGDGAVTFGGVYTERDPIEGPGVVLDGLGVGRRAFSAWSQWDGDSARAVLAAHPYDLFVIVAGSADANHRELDEASFRQELTTSLAAFRASVPDAPCVFVGPGDRAVALDATHVAVWPHHAWVNTVLADLAPTAHCVTWNLQADMGGAGSAVAWRDAGLMTADLLHLTPAGYGTVADRLLRVLLPPGASDAR